jgi:RNA polymerase subunit RPABC4/transcription elongation factor Spt4
VPSIYHKACPACTTLNAASAEQCASCGYSFVNPEDDGIAAEQQALDQALLLEDYLQARVEQALASVEAARTDLTRDPGNFDRIARVLRAVQEATERRAELNAQRLQTGEIRETLAALKVMDGQPAISEQPGEAFRAQQAARAEAAMAKFEGTATKTCPKCHTVLPVSTAMCMCGFAFARGDNALPRSRPGTTVNDPSLQKHS